MSQHSQRGFTLIELMVTITVMAILLAIAVPSFNDATLGSKLSSYANNLVASAHLARSEAIKRNAVVTLCASSNGTSCTGAWESGWVVLAGTNVIQRQQALPAGLKMIASGSLTSLGFQPTGLGVVPSPSSAVFPVTMKVCRATPTVGSQERVVSITLTGQPSVTRTTAGTCS